MIQAGREAAALLHEALRLIENVYEEDKKATALAASDPPAAAAVNRIDACHALRKQVYTCRYELRLSEDRRVLLYGVDSLTLLVELAAYHDALYRKDISDADSIWVTIEKIAVSLDSYYVPIDYEPDGAGLISKDALTRTQRREALRRCRKFRLAN